MASPIIGRIPYGGGFRDPYGTRQYRSYPSSYSDPLAIVPYSGSGGGSMNQAALAHLLAHGRQYIPNPYQQIVRRSSGGIVPYPPLYLPAQAYNYAVYPYAGTWSQGHGSSDTLSNRDRNYDVYPFATKDVAIRGKTYKIRKTFLEDNGKFEGELIKYVSSKKEKQLPDQVIGHLIDIINDRAFIPESLLDLVSLNVLASNLGVKSCMATSLKKLEKASEINRITGSELSDIAACVFLSSMVDDGLKKWLKDFIKKTRGHELLHEALNPEWRKLTLDHPDVKTGMQELLGLRPVIDDSDLRIG